MTVRLLSISKPVVPDVPNTSAMLAYCARVSSTANQHKHESGPRLLRSLVRRKEWSPFEMVSMTVEIHTTRDIARQILRHRSFSFQEFSQRYSEVVEIALPREARMQDHKDRQNSIETDDPDISDFWQSAQEHLGRIALDVYQSALKFDIAKEVARAVLPEGLTPSSLYMAGTLRSWLHYCQLRCDRKTQKEHRLIATDILTIIQQQFPELDGVLGTEFFDG